MKLTREQCVNTRARARSVAREAKTQYAALSGGEVPLDPEDAAILVEWMNVERACRNIIRKVGID